MWRCVCMYAQSHLHSVLAHCKYVFLFLAVGFSIGTKQVYGVLISLRNTYSSYIVLANLNIMGKEKL